MSVSILEDKLIQYFVDNNITLSNRDKISVIYRDNIFNNIFFVICSTEDIEAGSMEYYLKNIVNIAGEYIDYIYSDLFNIFRLLKIK